MDYVGKPRYHCNNVAVAGLWNVDGGERCRDRVWGEAGLTASERDGNVARPGRERVLVAEALC